MKADAVFECWAPFAEPWSLWARPILFAQMAEVESQPSAPAVRPAIDVTWAPPLADAAVLVIDLPGEQAVWTGLALAGRGYRPVPLFNACTGPHEVIDHGPIIHALRVGAEILAKTPLTGAPPAFLLDAQRMNPPRLVQPDAFDNRWQVFAQDFPSAAFLTARHLTGAVLIQRGRTQPQEDLAHVLRRWQDAGLKIGAKDINDAAPVQPIQVELPARYRSPWQRVLAILGLRRGPHGGFGGMVPRPGQG